MIQDDLKTPRVEDIDTNFLLNSFHIVAYDFILWIFSMVIHTYFRDIESRGVQFIPKTGPIVFVIAPHANQFVDPLVVMSKVKEHAHRRIALLIAAKSYRLKFIGAAAQLTGAIPVERAQDLLKTATGTIKIDSSFDDEVVITGVGTKFLSECEPKGLIGLPNSLASAQIESIESDTRLKIKKPFVTKASKKVAQISKLLAEGTVFKVAPHIDNDVVFRNVFKHLNSGKVLGIFPEGGSHDRPNLLPLKAGVAIMALGAWATSKDPDYKINVIPVGLNYFHPHKFRSRCVVEFGEPIVVDKSHWGPEYEQDSKKAIGDLLSEITKRLSTVTVSCEDYDTMMALQAARRLFTASNRENIPITMVTEMNRRLIKGYEKYADDPGLIAIKAEVSQYNKKLKQMGLHDYQVTDLTSSNRLKTSVMFLERLFKVILFLGLLLPGIFLFSPVFIVGKQISRRKAKEALAGSSVKIKANDVLATWKILVALGLAPCLYIFYSVIGTIFIHKLGILLPYSVPNWLTFLIFYGWSVLTTYASLRIGEIGVDYYKSLKPLMYSVLSHHLDIIQIKELKDQRKRLAEQVTEFCNTHGPKLFDDYGKFYNDYNNIPDDDYYNSEEDSELEEPKDKIGLRTSPGSDQRFHPLNYLGDVPIFSHQDDEDVSEKNEVFEVKTKENIDDNKGDSVVRQRKTKKVA